jgi:hypothetical protein
MISVTLFTFFSLSSCRWFRSVVSAPIRRQRQPLRSRWSAAMSRSSTPDIALIRAAAPSRFTQVNVLRRASFPHESETTTFPEWPSWARRSNHREREDSNARATPRRLRVAPVN